MLLLTEHALTAHDVTRLARLHGPEPTRAFVLVPVDTRHNRLVEALDDVALGRVREAFTDSGSMSPPAAEAIARAAMEDSRRALEAEGVASTGALVPDDPVDAVVELAAREQADEVIVVTEPHLLEEAVRRDWASRLRGALDLPVLHVVAGTDRVVS